MFSMLWRGLGSWVQEDADESAISLALVVGREIRGGSFQGAKDERIEGPASIESGDRLSSAGGPRAATYRPPVRQRLHTFAMPFTTSPTDPEHPRPEHETGAAQSEVAPEPVVVDPKAPLSFVPHETGDGQPRQPVRIRTGRYGEIDEHELIHLLDSIEDERARSRFRESIYISLFIWIAIAWVVLYGPRYLWHAPKLVTPFDVLQQREVTQLNLPAYHPHVSAPRPAPKVDTHTLEHLRSEEPPAPRTPPPAPTPTPKEAAPAPAPSMTSSAPPTPSPAMPLPSAPQPAHRPPPVVAEAPTPQPSAHPDFNTGNSSAENSIQDAIRNAARHPGGGEGYGRRGGGGSSPLNFGGVDILSDTQGVDFNPYIRRLLQDIYRNWLPLIPEEAQPPLSKQGETLIRFSILPDGRIGSMHLDGSTHDDAINRSCWGSITSEGQFPPLPSQFHGPDLELRIHYYVNKQPE